MARRFVPYGLAGEGKGVIAYEIGDDCIWILFADGRMYLYDSATPGREHVERMKALARAGSGLTSYISRHVKHAYSRRIRAA